MNKLFFLFLVLLSTFSYANDFRSVPAEKMDWSIKNGKAWCVKCGMNLSKFYKTSHVLHNTKGDSHTCSLHCLADVMKTEKGTPKVVDTNTLKLINAREAFYVIGSSKPGTMTMMSKYAFKSKSNAIEFQKKFGGKVVNFQKALEMANKSFHKESKMISMKRKRKIYPMGKKIYNKKCNTKKIDSISSLNVADIKLAIQKDSICGELKPMQLQMVALYVKFGKNSTFTVPEKSKCPVCGMFVAKYPKWSVKLTANGKDHYFDGMKDYFKYNLKNKKGTAIGRDYYTLNDINIKKAFFVIGSDVLGPMGHELIPFLKREDAKKFKKEHKGKKIVTFLEVNAELLKQLDQ